MSRPPPIRFTYEEAAAADEESVFNCGPAALCAVIGLTIPQFYDLQSAKEFVKKGYTNPTLMLSLLRDAQFRHLLKGWKSESAADRTDLAWPSFGLARIQWGGPWMAPGVPIRARYRKTHWVGCWREPEVRQGPFEGVHVFDVNALWQTRTVLGIPGWLRLVEWARALVPQILDGEPRASGEWWLTDAIEVRRP
jgi:hypothetical protein